MPEYEATGAHLFSAAHSYVVSSSASYKDGWIICVGPQWFFFFSSRRRHTRLQGDWSSDVCSSDLFLRLWWELCGSAISLPEGWVSYAKGGTYSPFVSDFELALLWCGNGAEVKAFRDRKSVV